MSEHNGIPALTLIFSSDADDEEMGDRLLDISDLAIDAIEKAESRLSILKAFTFQAGKPYESQAAELSALRERNAELEGSATISTILKEQLHNKIGDLQKENALLRSVAEAAERLAQHLAQMGNPADYVDDERAFIDVLARWKESQGAK